MKRKYIIEAGVAGVVLSLLLLVTVPQFIRVQIQSQPAALQTYIEDAIKISTTKPLSDLYKLKGTVDSSYHGPLTKKNLGRVTLYTSGFNISCDADHFAEAFPELGRPAWMASDVQFILEARVGLKSTTYFQDHWSDAEFEEAPFVIAIKAIVGNRQDWKPYQTGGSIFIADIDDKGYFNIIGGGIPFSSSNGITSYGEFYADTTSIWPPAKAVIMDPPPNN